MHDDDETTADTLAARVARLERANARLRRVLGGVAASALALLLTGQVLPDGRILEGQGLVIRDAQGRERLVVRTDDTGSTTLRLVEPGGKGGLDLGARFDGGVGMVLADKAGKPRLQLDVAGLIPTLRLAGMRGSATVSVGGDGPRIVLLDEKESTVFRAPLPGS